MATGLPQWALGRNISITLLPLIVAGSGQVSADTVVGTQSFNGRIDRSGRRIALTTDNISPTNAFNGNPVPYEYSTTYNITEIVEAFPLVDNQNFGFGYGNVLESALEISFYQYMTYSVYDNSPTPLLIVQDSAYLLFSDLGQESPKQKNNYEGTFSTIIVVDTQTGLYLANPTIFSAVSGFN